MKIERDGNDRLNFMREYKASQLISIHENLVEYIEYGQQIVSSEKPDLNGKNYLALEFAANGSILDY